MIRKIMSVLSHFCLTLTMGLLAHSSWPFFLCETINPVPQGRPKGKQHGGGAAAGGGRGAQGGQGQEQDEVYHPVKCATCNHEVRVRKKTRRYSAPL